MFVILLHLLSLTAAWDVNFIVDFYTKKEVRYVSQFFCDTRHNIDVARSLIMRNISVSSVKVSKNNNVSLTRYLHQRSSPIGVLLDGSCEGVSSVLEESSKNNLFDSTHIWLITSNASDVLVSLASMNLSVDADVVIATRNGDKYDFVEVFNYGKIQGNTIETKYLGSWTSQNKKGLNFTINKFKYYDRWDFHNLTLRVVTVILGRPKKFSPEMLTSVSYTKGVSVFTKTAAIVLKPLREIHNFKFNYTVVGRWIGPTDENASLAVTNSLYWRQQDLSCTSARITSQWLQWVDAIHPPVTKLESRFFYLIPNKGIGNYENRFLTPLSAAVWWCSVAAGVCCVLVLGVSAAVEGRSRPGVYAVLSVCAAVCQQAYEEGIVIFEERISSQGRRVTLLVIGITSMLMYNYYTSSVVSWLLNAVPPTLADIDGLINSDFELIFEDIGYTRGWFEDAGFFYYGGYKNPKEDELRDKKVIRARRKKPLYQSVEDGIQLIRSGDYAYHTEPYTAYQTISRTFSDAELCRLGSLPMIRAAPVYIMTQKRSPYKEFFDWSLLRLKERGHISAAQAQVAGFRASCSGSSPRALALGQAAPAFVLLVAAMVFCMMILAVEVLWYRWEKKRGRMITSQNIARKF